MCKIIQKCLKTEIWNAKRGNNVWVPSSVDINNFSSFFFNFYYYWYSLLFLGCLTSNERLCSKYDTKFDMVRISFIFSKNIYRIHDHPPYRHAIGTEKRAILLFLTSSTLQSFLLPVNERKKSWNRKFLWSDSENMFNFALRSCFLSENQFSQPIITKCDRI